MSKIEERRYLMWLHLSGLSSYFLIPLGHLWLPLLLWSMKRKSSEAVDQHGIEVLNFQVTISFYLMFSWILVFIGIGLVFLPVVILLHVIATVMAAVYARQGKFWRYPATFRVIRQPG